MEGMSDAQARQLAEAIEEYARDPAVQIEAASQGHVNVTFSGYTMTLKIVPDVDVRDQITSALDELRQQAGR